jgi:hypothetical protein
VAQDGLHRKLVGPLMSGSVVKTKSTTDATCQQNENSQDGEHEIPELSYLASETNTG